MPKEWECVGQSEIDKYANMVLRYHYPNVKNYGDITKIETGELPNFNLLCGGSPCQDLSLAGRRKGLEGKRSGLFYEYIRILKAKKPDYFIWENVKGTLSSNQGWDFAEVINQFSEAGYNLWWQVLNAKDFGVPQNRERIFVYGFRNGSPREILFKRQEDEGTDVVSCITATYAKGDSATHYNEHSSGRTLIYYKKSDRQINRIYKLEGIAPALNTGQGGRHTPAIVASVLTPDRLKKRQNGRRFKEDGEPSFTLTGQDIPGVSINEKVRKLTPTECERLMSWEDGWTKYGIDEKGQKIKMSDSQRYKMCGNGVVSNVIREVVKGLV